MHQSRVFIRILIRGVSSRLGFVIIAMDSSLKKSQSDLSHVKSKIKLVFLGDQSTGKTSILMRFISDKFEDGIGATVGIDFMAKNLTVLNQHLRLQLWDTAGQQRFRSLIPSYLKDACIVVLVFDITNRRSFTSMREWIDLCNQNKKEKSIIVLVGNKLDLSAQREVTFEEAEKLADSEKILYFEVSAKSSKNISEMFTGATEKYVREVIGYENLSDETSHKSKSAEAKDSINNIIALKSGQVSSKDIKKQGKSGCC